MCQNRGRSSKLSKIYRQYCSFEGHRMSCKMNKRSECQSWTNGGQNPVEVMLNSPVQFEQIHVQDEALAVVDEYIYIPKATHK